VTSIKTIFEQKLCFGEMERNSGARLFHYFTKGQNVKLQDKTKSPGRQIK